MLPCASDPARLRQKHLEHCKVSAEYNRLKTKSGLEDHILAHCHGISIVPIIGGNLNEKVSALDPVDVLNNKIGIAAGELTGTIHNLVQAHSRGNLK